MGQVTPSAGHDSGLAVLITSVAAGPSAMTRTRARIVVAGHEASSRTKSGQRPGSIRVTVSDTSSPASSAPTRCRPAQMYGGLYATGQRPSTVGPSHSASTWSVAGSSITSRRFFSICRAWREARKAARAKRLRFGGPSAGSCRQARVRSRARHRPRLDRTGKRRCVSNALRRCLSHVPRWRDAGRMQTPLPQ